MNKNIKFVLVCNGRSGSSVITKALGQHPNLNVAGEPFNPEINKDISEARKSESYNDNVDHINTVPEVYHWLKELYNEQDINKILRKEDVTKFTDKLYSVYNGFKILYYQIPRHHVIWEHIVKIPNIKIIHLVRNNFLNLALSSRMAEDSCVWQRFGNETIYDKAVELDPLLLKGFFEELQDKVEYFSNFLQGRMGGQYMEIEYSEIFNWKKLMYKMQNFIGVEPILLSKVFKKRIIKKPIELISNYKEISNYFKKTKWEKFFQIKLL